MSPRLLLAPAGADEMSRMDRANKQPVPFSKAALCPLCDDQCNDQKNEIKTSLFCFYLDHNFLLELNKLFGIPWDSR